MNTPTTRLKALKQSTIFLLIIFFFLGFTSSLSPASAPSPSTDLECDSNNDNCPPPPPTAFCNSDDSNTLLQIKEAFNNSDNFDTWVPGTDCCNGWDFIGCHFTGRVNAFNFFGNSPFGRNDLPTIFPPAVGNLTFLTNLVYKNNVTGPIPDFLSNLQSLVFLDLTNNRLTGPIPSFIANFSQLSVLSLSFNQLSGSIPPQLSQLSNLNSFSLTSNNLTGCIPGGLFSLFNDPFNNGVFFSAGSNRLSGRIPRSFASVNFRRLELQDNKLKGDASFLFGKDKWLWNLDLSGNSLSFNMTELEVPSAMITVLLNNNKLVGSLPPSLVNVTSLSFFNVSYNQLCGQIPQGGRLQQFDEFAYAHNKCLCGSPLPPCN